MSLADDFRMASGVGYTLEGMFQVVITEARKVTGEKSKRFYQHSFKPLGDDPKSFDWEPFQNPLSLLFKKEGFTVFVQGDYYDNYLFVDLHW